MRVVDTRTSSDGELLLFVTCQMPGKDEAMLPAAQAIVRRLRDYCIGVDFDFIPKSIEETK